MVVSDKLYSPVEYIETITGNYYEDVNTVDEIMNVLMSEGVEVDLWKLSEVYEIPLDVCVALVSVSSDSAMIEYIPLLFEVPDRCASSFKKGE